MEALDLRKREASRARQRGAAKAAAAVAATERHVKPEPSKVVAPAAPKKPDRAEVRRRVIQTAIDNQSELDGCLDDEELEERLRQLLTVAERHRRDVRPRRATQTRSVAQFVESDEETDGTSDY
jgi:hypothetical protein